MLHRLTSLVLAVVWLRPRVASHPRARFDHEDGDGAIGTYDAPQTAVVA